MSGIMQGGIQKTGRGFIKLVMDFQRKNLEIALASQRV
jgi:hypothetical protein